MSSYIGLHADFYDVFYKEKDYKQESEFIHSLISENNKGGIMLELACGTGNHSFYFEKLQYKITASDYSPDMIARAKAKAALKNSENKFEVADMTALPFEDTSFDTVICLFDSIGYVQTNSLVSKAISEAYRVLKPGGQFIVEFWHAGAMIKDYDHTRVKRFTCKGQELTRISETTMDIQRQTCDVKYTIYIKELGNISVLTETQTNRFFLCQEMKQFLSQEGFSEIEFFDGFSVNKVNTATWHVVAQCTK